MIRQAWVEHTFNLPGEPQWGHNIATRVSDVAIRCQHHLAGLSDHQLSQRPEDQWSIKEHVGHLIDLEQLHMHRLNQFAEMKKELVAADMSNTLTESNDHNAATVEHLIAELGDKRKALIEQFWSLTEASMLHSAFHPRLRVQMKPVDILFFAGEHDDHHIASMLELKLQLKQ